MDPVRSMDDVKTITHLEPEKSVGFVGEALGQLRQEVGNNATVLGFVGAPFTLASYIVEGGTSTHYKVIKKMAFDSPEVYHALLESITDSVIEYVKYQADSGAQVVQIFDSWASEFSPADFERFCLPCLKRIVGEVKQTHPDLPSSSTAAARAVSWSASRPPGRTFSPWTGRWTWRTRWPGYGAGCAGQHGPCGALSQQVHH